MGTITQSLLAWLQIVVSAMSLMVIMFLGDPCGALNMFPLLLVLTLFAVFRQVHQHMFTLVQYLHPTLTSSDILHLKKQI